MAQSSESLDVVIENDRRQGAATDVLSAPIQVRRESLKDIAVVRYVT
jgi:hypothetical protein